MVSVHMIDNLTKWPTYSWFKVIGFLLQLQTMFVVPSHVSGTH